MEIWQVLGSLTGLSLSVLLGMLSARLLIIFLRRPVEQEFSTPKWFRPSLVFCLTLFFASPVPIIFGVPPQIRHVTVPIIGIDDHDHLEVAQDLFSAFQPNSGKIIGGRG
jgi:hypothetical protein